MHKTKRIFLTGVAGVGLLVGGFGVANAASSATPSVPTPAPASAAPVATDAATPAAGVDNSNQDPAHEAAESPAQAANEQADKGGDGNGDHNETVIAGSVAAPAEDQGQAETDESAALAPLAKITADRAAAVAIAAVPGTSGTPTLESDGGFVVYKVVVTTATGDIEVIVDAGDGKVLAQEAHHGDGGGPDDGNEHVDTNAEPSASAAG